MVKWMPRTDDGSRPVRFLLGTVSPIPTTTERVDPRMSRPAKTHENSEETVA